MGSPKNAESARTMRPSTPTRITTIYPSPPPTPIAPGKAAVSNREEKPNRAATPPGENDDQTRTGTLNSSQKEEDLIPESAELPPWPTPTSMEEFINSMLRENTCGGRTTNNTPCKRSRRPVARSVVNEGIISLRSLPPSCSHSKMVESLKRLALLLHCSMHRSERSVNTRVEAWLTEYFLRPGDTTALLRKALQKYGTKCNGTKDDARPCQESIGGRQVLAIQSITDRILEPEVYLHDGRLKVWLKRLGQNTLCPQHRDEQLQEQVAKLTAAVTIARGSQLSTEITRGISENQHETEEPWQGYDTSPLHLVADLNSGSQGCKPDSNYLQTIRDCLIPRNYKPGYVYAYTVDANEAFVKIGYTTREVSVRHAEWEFECNRKIKSLYPDPAATGVPILHPRLIESICHADLWKGSVRVDCSACQKEHVEWFKISAQKAIDTIEKWSQWMARVACRPSWKNEVKMRVRGTSDLAEALHALMQLCPATCN
ncbi:GIY-YIG nuclease family protein [Aspergillus fijiensis CBS 313.89]|uniref:DUF1766-domain-containing protein n=1 Tax=Aspergillus fijiensis CBS 313.89 TaxID=1448319 RepID=A0A8G1RSF5_9EURO|nr:DUF1766-domain-containing protein [Aspergillus fijiensis CBS 313.89]RAK77453.1 DUF1766-domain-containing protein [Aspergillus fijiensis CBS 313.89]